jgi:hypothetical protein
MRLENDDADPAKTYSPLYSDNPRIELLVLGAVSLCLTLVNIISIFLAGIIVLKVSLPKQLTSLLAHGKEIYVSQNLYNISRTLNPGILHFVVW